MTVAITSRYDKCQNAAFRLNEDAYRQQVQRTARGKLKQFVPCAKADVLVAASVSSQHIALVEMDVIATECPCHPGLLLSELMDMEYDGSARRRHHGEAQAGGEGE